MPMPADDDVTAAGNEERIALDLLVPRRIHIIGIGGAGMSAIAIVLRTMGHVVSGSDLRDSPVAQRLRSQGITVSIGHRAEHVGDADVVTYSPAVQPENVELVQAGSAGVLIVPRSQMLAAICATRRCLAVAGTHGKTTTASMLSLILVEAGLRPSFVIGADVNEIGTNAVWDTGEWLVVEADESFGTFRAIRADVAVLTNVEPDHLDYYGTFDELRTAFSEFVGAATEGAVVCADDPEAAAIGEERGALTVGSLGGPTYRMTDLELARSSVSFTLLGPDGTLGRLDMGVPGLHNARNGAVAAVAALQAGAPFEAAQAALARFAGVTRRFEFRGEAGGVTFVDDYAHLPTEVRAALATARDRRLVPGRGGLPATPFLPHRRPGQRVRHRVCRRRRPGRHGRLQRRRAAGAGRVGPIGGRCGPLVRSAAARRLRPRLGAAPRRRGRDPAGGRSLLDPGRGRPHIAARRPARLAVVVTAASVLEALADALGPRARRHEPLGPMTTYGVGGSAALFAEVEGAADLEAIRTACRQVGAAGSGPGDAMAVFVIGRGSNLLVADAGFEGLVLHLGSGFAGLALPDPAKPASAQVDPRPTVRAGAALSLPILARRVADAGWSGLSWAVGVPGSVGGAVRMNAGGHGSDMAACLVRYRWVDLLGEDGGTDGVDRLGYGYRHSTVGASQIVLEADLAVRPGTAEEERASVSDIVKWRREHQPGGSNAGSVFTNPEGDSAGRLIEAAGLRGFRLGTAHVSEKHANFIQADKGGRADDVRALMEHVRVVVREQSGIELAAEVRLLGFDAGKTGPMHRTKGGDR